MPENTSILTMSKPIQHHPSPYGQPKQNISIHPVGQPGQAGNVSHPQMPMPMSRQMYENSGFPPTPFMPQNIMPSQPPYLNHNSAPFLTMYPMPFHYHPYGAPMGGGGIPQHVIPPSNYSIPKAEKPRSSAVTIVDPNTKQELDLKKERSETEKRIKEQTAKTLLLEEQAKQRERVPIKIEAPVGVAATAAAVAAAANPKLPKEANLVKIPDLPDSSKASPQTGPPASPRVAVAAPVKSPSKSSQVPIVDPHTRNPILPTKTTAEERVEAKTPALSSSVKKNVSNMAGVTDLRQLISPSKPTPVESAIASSGPKSVDVGSAIASEDASLNTSHDISTDKVSTDKETDSGSGEEDEGAHSKPVIQYKPGMWSPLNPTGSKVYSRDFLLLFASVCKICPPQLPSCVNVNESDKTRGKSGKHNLRRTGSQEAGNFGTGNMSRQNSNFSRHGSNDGHMYRNNNNLQRTQSGSSINGSRGGGGNMNRRQLAHKRSNMNSPQIPVENFAPLLVCENKWTPYTPPADAKPELVATEIILRKVKGILNKLTLEKFESLSNQIVDLGVIENPEYLTGTINLIFKKAMDEPNFGVMYAKLCKFLADKDSEYRSTLVDENTTAPLKNSFRSLLLNQCQEEFEREGKLVIQSEKKDEEKTEADLEAEFELAVKLKRRMLGNIKFIGELYKLEMLRQDIMHDCIVHLLRKMNDEENIECLCQLMTTIGKTLDRGKNRSKVFQYTQRMESFSQNETLSSRIRFMLQDVCELRRNRWIPRRLENDPKTIEQIRLESLQEDRNSQMSQKNFHHPGKGYNNHNNNFNNNSNSHPNNHHQNQNHISSKYPPPLRGGPMNFHGAMNRDRIPSNDMGWNVVRNSASRASPYELTQHRQHVGSLPRNKNACPDVLYPGGNAGQAGPTATANGWSKSSTSGSFGALSCGSSENKFEALPISESARAARDETLRGGNLSKESSPTGAPSNLRNHHPLHNSQPPHRFPATSTATLVSSATSLRPGGSNSFAKAFSAPVAPAAPGGSHSNQNMRQSAHVASDANRLQSSPNGSSEPEERSGATGSFVEMTPKLERQFELILGEYLGNGDFEETKLSLADFDMNQIAPTLIRHILEKSLEKRESDRLKMNTLCAEMVSDHIVTCSQFIEGVDAILEDVESLVCDIPKVFEYVGLFLAESILENKKLLSFLKPSFRHLIETGKASLLLNHIMKVLLKSWGLDELKETFATFSIQVKDFLPSLKKNDEKALETFFQSLDLSENF